MIIRIDSNKNTRRVVVLEFYSELVVIISTDFYTFHRYTNQMR